MHPHKLFTNKSDLNGIVFINNEVVSTCFKLVGFKSNHSIMINNYASSYEVTKLTKVIKILETINQILIVKQYDLQFQIILKLKFIHFRYDY